MLDRALADSTTRQENLGFGSVATHIFSIRSKMHQQPDHKKSTEKEKKKASHNKNQQKRNNLFLRIGTSVGPQMSTALPPVPSIARCCEADLLSTARSPGSGLDLTTPTLATGIDCLYTPRTHTHTHASQQPPNLPTNQPNQPTNLIQHQPQPQPKQWTTSAPPW